MAKWQVNYETLLEKQRGVLASVRDDVNYFCNIQSLYLKGAIEGTPTFPGYINMSVQKCHIPWFRPFFT